MNAIALVIAVVALLLVLWVAIDLARVKRVVYSLPKDGGVYEALQQLDAKPGRSSVLKLPAVTSMGMRKRIERRRHKR